MTINQLTVWLDDQPIADLRAKRPWQLQCRYRDDVTASTLGNRPLLSCSLPVTSRRTDATSWVRGLLPEGQHLLALATAAGVPTNYFIDLLDRYGRDLAGAFSISTTPPDPRRWAIEPYTDEELQTDLRAAIDAPGFALRDDSELSIAGLQNKLLVVRTADGWARPIHGHPSSHIIKVDDARFPGLVAAEHAALTIARKAGIDAAESEHLIVGDIETIAVKRFDRTTAVDGSVRRLHKEDACQALGINIDAHHGRGKYEANGGPNLRAIALLLSQHADEPLVELERLARLVTFNMVIGNADAHGKNFSILIDVDTGAIRLAPAYDTVPTALWSHLRTYGAMTINGSNSPIVSANDIINEIISWSFPARRAEHIVDETISRIVDVAESVGHAALAELTASRAAEITKQ